MKVPYTKNIHNLLQGPQNPGFRSVKVQNETFSKRTHGISKKIFRVLMNPWQAWKAKLEGALFWVFITIKKQCGLEKTQN